MVEDPYKYFRIEARELMEQLGKATLDLEGDTPSPDLVPQILRAAHTLKGAARVVRQREIAELAHALEDALAPFRSEAASVPRPNVAQMLTLVDGIRAHVNALDAPIASLVPPATTTTTTTTTTTAATPTPDEPQRTLRADVQEVDGLLEGVAEAQGQLGALRRDVRTIERARRLAEVLTDQLGSPQARLGAGAGDKALSIADELCGLVSAFERSLSGGVELVDRELRQVRQAAERLRLLPAAAMFNMLERAVRDAADSLGKRALFETRGGDVRLDADVLGAVQNALLHAVRNAVAHGIETEIERAAAGKPRAGRIVLEIERRGSRAVFRCRDDGRGLDLPAVRRAVEARGLSANDTGKLADDDLVRLLLKGGISTARTVTAVAGRGIGLDVVRETAERLGGQVSVKTKPGAGTSLEISVPISLSSLAALVVEIDGHKAAIPLEAIRQIVRLAPGDIARSPAGESILFEGAMIPFAPLSGPLRLASSGAAVAGTKTARTWSAIIVQSGSTRAAIGVSRLLGTETVVVHPLPEAAPADPVVAGASFDAEGNPQIVLHPEALVAAAARCAPPERARADARLPVLVIDDSLTTRMLEQSILELAGYEVDLAHSGEEGLQKAASRRYALFLVDVEMPGMDGFTFVATTQKDPELRGIPAVLVTSRNAPEDRQRGAAVGAKAYIVKSEFDQVELLDRIRRLVA